MKLLSRNRTEAEASEDQHDERPPADEAPEPQPEHDEPRLEDPAPTELSKRDYIAVARRAFKEFNNDHMTNIAAALAYYACFAIGFGVLVLGPHLSTWVGNALHAKTEVKIAWYVAEWPLAVAGLLFAFAGLMYYGPNVKHPRWKFLSFGAVVALVIWLVASGAFAFYTSRFGSYNKTWGSLAAVVVMLTWLWLSSVALLLGAEVNAEAERSRELRRGEPAEGALQAAAKA